MDYEEVLEEIRNMTADTLRVVRADLFGEMISQKERDATKAHADRILELYSQLRKGLH